MWARGGGGSWGRGGLGVWVGGRGEDLQLAQDVVLLRLWKVIAEGFRQRRDADEQHGEAGVRLPQLPQLRHLLPQRRGVGGWGSEVKICCIQMRERKEERI